MVTHIEIAGRALCRPTSYTALVNTADCKQCNQRLDILLDCLLRFVATGAEEDRVAAATRAGKIGFDLKAYLPS